MSKPRKGTPFDRVLRIVHEGIKGAKERPDEVKQAAQILGVSFFDVVAVAIATEIVAEFNLDRITS